VRGTPEGGTPGEETPEERNTRGEEHQVRKTPGERTPGENQALISRATARKGKGATGECKGLLPEMNSC